MLSGTTQQSCGTLDMSPPTRRLHRNPFRFPICALSEKALKALRVPPLREEAALCLLVRVVASIEERAPRGKEKRTQWREFFFSSWTNQTEKKFTTSTWTKTSTVFFPPPAPPSAPALPLRHPGLARHPRHPAPEPDVALRGRRWRERRRDLPPLAPRAGPLPFVLPHLARAAAGALAGVAAAAPGAPGVPVQKGRREKRSQG